MQNYFSMSGKEKIKRHSVRTKGFSVWCLPELIKIPGDRYQYELEVLLKFYSGKEMKWTYRHYISTKIGKQVSGL